MDAPAEIWLKLENLQPIGSFKLRGAANAILSAPPEVLADGVVTTSTGNMAQGVAWMARELGVPATIVVPDNASASKLAAVERLGGRIVRLPWEQWWAAVAAEGTMVMGAGVDRLAEAVSTVLQAMARSVPDGVRVETSGAELRFIVAADGRAAQFDPWRGHGLAVPLACRLVVGVGGRVGGEAGGALAIAFPVEMAPE